VPSVAERARVRGATAEPVAGFGGQGSLTQKVPAVPVGRSENNAMLAGHRQLAEATFASPPISLAIAS
jgi:hypothetical protein